MRASGLKTLHKWEAKGGFASVGGTIATARRFGAESDCGESDAPLNAFLFKASTYIVIYSLFMYIAIRRWVDCIYRSSPSKRNALFYVSQAFFLVL